MGAIWTLNADAAETPAIESPAVVESSAVVETPAVETPADAAPVADAEPVPVPPKLLPWGAKPARLTRAKAGASSEAVAAAGADAAPADTSGSLVPTPEFGPKGRSSRGDALKSMRTTVVPPTPPGVAPAPSTTAYFHYAVSTQTGDTDGTWANLTVEKPKLVDGDFHTLAELSVQSADGEQIVEAGWNVDRSVNKDSDPHLFVYYWKDKKGQCYNACGFTMYSKTVKPGDTLPVGTQKRFGIQHSSGAWWVAYDSEWIGYFLDKNWDGKYTKAGAVQWFGEVAAATSGKPCTQMGNGLEAVDGNAARIGSISMTNGPAVNVAPRVTSKYYSVLWRSETTFRYGGPVLIVNPDDPDDPDNKPC
jgi:hypothetical protein